MKIRPKWLIFIGIILLFVGSAIYFIHYNFNPPGPDRSAFAGRLPGVWDGNKRRFQFFYATNRANTEETFNDKGFELGKAFLTGSFEVRIAPTLPIRPWVWFDNKYMEWAGRKELSQNQFSTQVAKAVQASPQKSILIIVWGFRDWFQSAALKTAYTAFVLDINTPVLLFDWPGNQGQGTRGYLAAQQVASQSAPDLGRTIAKVIHDTEAKKVWLMGSSLGAQTIVDAVAWLKTNHSQVKLDQVILSAPDVSTQAFDDNFLKTIQALSNHLTVFVSSNDRALLMSKWLNGKKRLGRFAQSKMLPENRASDYEFEEAAELLDLQAKGLKILSLVDATPINLTRNLHHFFTDSSEFFDDLYIRLLQPDNIISRRLYQVNLRQKRSYWVLWNE